MTCQNKEGCRIARGARHLSTCPRYGATSGPSGANLQARSSVDTAKLERIRTLLALPNELTPNAILDAVILHLGQPPQQFPADTFAAPAAATWSPL